MPTDEGGDAKQDRESLKSEKEEPVRSSMLWSRPLKKTVGLVATEREMYERELIEEAVGVGFKYLRLVGKALDIYLGSEFSRSDAWFLATQIEKFRESPPPPLKEFKTREDLLSAIAQRMVQGERLEQELKELKEISKRKKVS